MNKPLLSICIPTYNRANYLIKSIESIICQDEFKTKKVEIVISDNASTDDTELIATNYASQYENIFYFQNEKNINNNNFPLAISRGNGVLRRLCNDTLCFKEGSLKYICNIIERNIEEKPVICWTNTGNKPDFKMMDFKNGIRNLSYRITAISCFSIWDSDCNKIEKDTYGAELLLWQVRKTLELAYEKNKMAIISTALVFNQPVQNKDISYGLYHVFYENYFKLLNPYFENGSLTYEDKDFLEKDLLFNFFLEWCVKWKLQSTTMQYSKTESLQNRVYQKFCNKPYWKEYKRKYYILYWKTVIIKILKRGY
ncbi:MAG: glycosyltransferase [Lachnospiraceae bacterium]|nr:glycosyltransferase [Lachnospiraceae bacterium]